MTNFLSRNITASWHISRSLFVVMIPIQIAVELLKYFGLIDEVSYIFKPLMELVGLPQEFALVWVSALFVNIYSGVLVWYSLSEIFTLTVAQSSVLALMILIAHALPLESGISHKVGVNFWFISVFRFLMALCAGAAVFWLALYWDVLQQPSTFFIQMPTEEKTFFEYLFNQLFILVEIFIIIFVLVVFLDLLKIIGIEQKIIELCKPILQSMGLHKEAANICIIGLLLGISYGGALLIKEAKNVNLLRKDILGAIIFLSLCHAVIEDTILLLVTGANIFVILGCRIVFTCIITAACMYFCSRTPSISNLVISKRLRLEKPI